MALINCSECEKQVSDKAAACPNCGNPIATVQPKMTRPIDDFKPVENKLRCPKCNSTNLTANRKGYSAGKAAVGVVLTGGVGLLAGAIGSGKVDITCLSCGYKHRAGEYQKEKNKIETQKQISNTEFDPVVAGVVIPPIAGFFLGFMIGILGDGHWWYIFTMTGIGIGVSILVLIISHFAEKSKINSNSAKEAIDSQIKAYLDKGEFSQAVNFYKKIPGVTEIEAKDYVNKIAAE